MGPNCVINFENNPDKVVYSNDLLHGNVQLRLTEAKTVRSVFIKFSGDSHTEWYIKKRDRSSNHNRTKRRYYRGHENFLTKRISLAGGDNGSMQLGRGEHNFNFQFRLPAHLPSSFEGTFGFIRYVATVVLDIPNWPDDEFEQPFTVIKPLDLNDELELRNPVVVEENHTYYPCFLLCCFPSDPLSIVAQMPVGGYAPGQTINLTLNADNRSNTRVPEFKMELVQSITYYAEGDSKHQTICIVEKESSRGVETNQKRIIRINLEVPSFPPSDETTSGIIKIRYFIRISGSGTCCDNPEIILPITIGTKPIEDFAETVIPDAYSPSAPFAPNIQPSAPPMMNNDSAPPYVVDEPPTYEEAIHSKGSTGNNYKPKYRMFRRQTSYSLNGN
ncbi:arrestin domain-containing protein 17-like [Contarinia nasturtii]|uniref:arrestin domain-containing protein 17-like n=1 Tax=Contarinia nasturtii TaxID=265458 RepID=UPI0012D39464|nr:arrestin domain-containing protein 17-like [Contarinia nasturtii]